MPNLPTYLDSITIIEKTMPLSKSEAKQIAEMRKVLGKGNVLSPKQKKTIDEMMANAGGEKMMMMKEMKKMPDIKTQEPLEYIPEGFGLDETGTAMMTKPAPERYKREAKKGEYNGKASEADMNDKLEADRQVGMPNVFDLAKEDAAAAAKAMLRTPAPAVR